MSRLLVVGRLVARDLRRRPGQAVLMLLAITAATAALTLGLVLHGVTSQPYQQTRAATRGRTRWPTSAHRPPPGCGRAPAGRRRDEAAEAGPDPGREAGPDTGGDRFERPFPLAGALVRANGLTAGAEAEGRDEIPAAVDQPKLTAGSWVRTGGAVLERTFAAGLGAGVGDRITLNGRAFTVSG